jgi:hypothetical protein
MRNDRSSSNRIAAWRWRGSQLHDAVISEGVGRVHHRKPFAIVEPFAAQLALAVALIGVHSLTREMQSCRSLFRVRVGKPLADVFLGLLSQPPILGLRDPFGLVLTGLGQAAFPSRSCRLFGRGHSMNLSRPQRLMGAGCYRGRPRRHPLDGFEHVVTGLAGPAQRLVFGGRQTAIVGKWMSAFRAVARRAANHQRAPSSGGAANARRWRGRGFGRAGGDIGSPSRNRRYSPS